MNQFVVKLYKMVKCIYIIGKYAQDSYITVGTDRRHEMLGNILYTFAAFYIAY